MNSRLRTLVSISFALALLLPAARSQDCVGDPGFEVSISPPVVEIGGAFEECLVTPPGNWSVFLLPSLFTGTTPTKAGTLCVAPPFLLLVILQMPPDGHLCLGSRLIPCDPALVGITGYFQFVAVSGGQPTQYGLSNLASLSIVDGNCNDPCTGSIGDFVWDDLDADGIQDAGEPGIPGVKLLLKNPSGDLLDMATTDGAGHYSFDNLCSAYYVVEVDESTLPPGYVRSPCDVGGDDAVDSDCSPVAVVLPKDTTDDTIDFGYFQTTPGLALEKSADKLVVAPYEPVTYSYTVTNTGGTTLTNIVVTDDNGTPDYADDDFEVGTIPSLAPGAFAVLTAQVIPVVCTGAVVNGVPVDAGSVIVVVPQANGDIRVTYLQDFGINDNTYGTGAVGWPGNNHTFKQLTGSDKLEFRFFDADDRVVLDFYQDYLTASAAFPSGYGSLGATGGDGSLVTGNAGDIVSATTSLAQNLNNPANLPFTASLIVNSPTSLVGGDVVVDPAKAPGGWNPINSYTVLIKASAFGASGFGSVAVPDQHNSPNKLGGPNGMATTPVDCTVVNTAIAVTATANGTLSATATASVDIVVDNTGSGSCDLRISNEKFDKKEVQITILNGASTDAVLNALTLTWPAANGKLMQVKLDGDVVYDTPDIPAPTANLTSADLVSDLNKRTIAHGTSDVLHLVFEHDVDKDPRHYSNGLLTFGTDCTLVIP